MCGIILVFDQRVPLERKSDRSAIYSRPQQQCWGLFVCAVLFWSATNESRLPATPAVSHLFRKLGLMTRLFSF